MTGNPKKSKVLVVTRKEVVSDVFSVFIEGLLPSSIEVADTTRKIELRFSEDGKSPRELDLLIVEDAKLLANAGKTAADFSAPAIHLKSPIRLADFSAAFDSIKAVPYAGEREFCPVRLEVLVLYGKALSHDLYKQKGDQSFEIIFPAGHRLDLSDSTFTELSRSKYLFLKLGDFKAFIGEFASAVQATLSEPEKVFDLGASLSAGTTVHDLLTTALPEFGFTPELQRAAKASIDLAIKAIQRDPRLADLLAAFAKLESGYKSWHSVALCYIACRLSSLMTWNSANAHFKLSLAAFLHDMTASSPALERARTKEELDNANVPEEEREKFREHPFAAAALAREMSDFPGDVDLIVAQHHELPGGQGFPLGLNHTKISPLASVFIVAHALTEELFDKQENFNLKETVERLELTYSQGYFRRVIAGLKELALKETATL